MIEDRELLVLAVAALALVAAIKCARHLGAERHLAIGALASLCVGLILTVVESGFEGVSAEVCNVIEHTAYLAHTALLLLWVRRSSRPRTESPK